MTRGLTRGLTRGRPRGLTRGIMRIVLRSLRQHALSTAITVLSVALASGLVMAVFAIKRQSYEAFTGGPVGFDAVLGARGSQLQLVLNTVFHLETSPGNISFASYTAIAADPGVALAVPYAVGDNFHGYRVVGTTDELFTKFEYRAGHKLDVAPGGRIFTAQERGAVVGSVVARQVGVKVGDHIRPYHGLQFDEAQQHDDDYEVVGILEPSNSPSDRVVWIPILGIYRMSGHVLRGTGRTFRPHPDSLIPEEHREVSAVMLKLTDPTAGIYLDQAINRQGKSATLAWPIGRVMADLFGKIGWVNEVLALVAYLVVVVAAGSILASIYNTMNERRREFAILRSLGARRGTVFSAIVLESTTITVLGVLVGYVVYAAILGAAFVAVRAQTGVVLDAWRYDPALLLTPMGMCVLGALAGLVPAFKAYRTDVASNLMPNS
ncbi:MAG: ABC transporter permease [Gemmatimonadaceae bacterium]|nr:ABC transporter permease [Gemmatimonadaceae bacterium]